MVVNDDSYGSGGGVSAGPSRGPEGRDRDRSGSEACDQPCEDLARAVASPGLTRTIAFPAFCLSHKDLAQPRLSRQAEHDSCSCLRCLDDVQLQYSDRQLANQNPSQQNPSLCLQQTCQVCIASPEHRKAGKHEESHPHVLNLRKSSVSSSSLLSSLPSPSSPSAISVGEPCSSVALPYMPCVEGSVAMVALECELPVGGRLSPPADLCRPAETISTSSGSLASGTASAPHHQDGVAVSVDGLCGNDTLVHTRTFQPAPLSPTTEVSSVGGIRCPTNLCPCCDAAGARAACDIAGCSSRLPYVGQLEELVRTDLRHQQAESALSSENHDSDSIALCPTSKNLSIINASMPSERLANHSLRAGSKRKLPHCQESIRYDDDDDNDFGNVPLPETKDLVVCASLHKSPSSLCLSALDDTYGLTTDTDIACFQSSQCLQGRHCGLSRCGGAECENLHSPCKKRRVHEEPGSSKEDLDFVLLNCLTKNHSLCKSTSSLSSSSSLLSSSSLPIVEKVNIFNVDEEDYDEKELVIEVVVDDLEDYREQQPREADETVIDVGTASDFASAESLSRYTDLERSCTATVVEPPISLMEIDLAADGDLVIADHPTKAASVSSVTSSAHHPSSSPPTTSSEAAEAACIVSSEDAESVVEVDVVGIDVMEVPILPEAMSFSGSTTSSLTPGAGNGVFLAAEHCSSIALPSPATGTPPQDSFPGGLPLHAEQQDMYQHRAGGGDRLENSECHQERQGVCSADNTATVASVSSTDDGNNKEDDDDDAFSNYVVYRQQRISPFLNTPKQRKEERRKVLKLSISKMRAVEDPEHFLRRSVLINNTMKRLQRELREEKMRHSGVGGGRRPHCYGMYRRAASLHYDVLNANSYQSPSGGYFSVHDEDEPYGSGYGASGCSSSNASSSSSRDDRGVADSSRGRGGFSVEEEESGFSCRVEAASSSSSSVVMTSSSLCPGMEDDSEGGEVSLNDVGLDSGCLLSLATSSSAVATPMDCSSSTPTQEPAYPPVLSYPSLPVTSLPAYGHVSSGSSYYPDTPRSFPARSLTSYPASSSTDCGSGLEAAMTSSSYCEVEAAGSVSCCLEVSSTVADPEELAASPVIRDIFPSPLCSGSSTSSCAMGVTFHLHTPAAAPAVPESEDEAFAHPSSFPMVDDVVGELTVPSFGDGPEAMIEGDEGVPSLSLETTTTASSPVPFCERLSSFASFSSPYAAPSSPLLPPLSSACGFYDGPGSHPGGVGSIGGGNCGVRDCPSPTSPSSSCSSESQREKQLYADIDSVFNNLIHALGDS